MSRGFPDDSAELTHILVVAPHRAIASLVRGGTRRASASAVRPARSCSRVPRAWLLLVQGPPPDRLPADRHAGAAARSSYCGEPASPSASRTAGRLLGALLSIGRLSRSLSSCHVLVHALLLSSTLTSTSSVSVFLFFGHVPQYLLTCALNCFACVASRVAICGPRLIRDRAVSAKTTSTWSFSARSRVSTWPRGAGQARPSTTTGSSRAVRAQAADRLRAPLHGHWPEEPAAVGHDARVRRRPPRGDAPLARSARRLRADPLRSVPRPTWLRAGRDREVLVERAADFRKSFGTRMLIPLLGTASSPPRATSGCGTAVSRRPRSTASASTATAGRWPATPRTRRVVDRRRVVDLHDEMTALTLRIVAVPCSTTTSLPGSMRSPAWAPGSRTSTTSASRAFGSSSRRGCRRPATASSASDPASRRCRLRDHPRAPPGRGPRRPALDAAPRAR